MIREIEDLESPGVESATTNGGTHNNEPANELRKWANYQDLGATVGWVLVSFLVQLFTVMFLWRSLSSTMSDTTNFVDHLYKVLNSWAKIMVEGGLSTILSVAMPLILAGFVPSAFAKRTDIGGHRLFEWLAVSYRIIFIIVFPPFLTLTLYLVLRGFAAIKKGNTELIAQGISTIPMLVLATIVIIMAGRYRYICSTIELARDEATKKSDDHTRLRNLFWEDLIEWKAESLPISEASERPPAGEDAAARGLRGRLLCLRGRLLSLLFDKLKSSPAIYLNTAAALAVSCQVVIVWRLFGAEIEFLIGFGSFLFVVEFVAIACILTLRDAYSNLEFGRMARRTALIGSIVGVVFVFSCALWIAFNVPMKPGVAVECENSWLIAVMLLGFTLPRMAISIWGKVDYVPAMPDGFNLDFIVRAKKFQEVYVYRERLKRYKFNHSQMLYFNRLIEAAEQGGLSGGPRVGAQQNPRSGAVPDPSV